MHPRRSHRRQGTRTLHSDRTLRESSLQHGPYSCPESATLTHHRIPADSGDTQTEVASTGPEPCPGLPPHLADSTPSSEPRLLRVSFRCSFRVPRLSAFPLLFANQ